MKLLDALDEKLQLGLLDHLRRVTSYHFEGGTLTIEPGEGNDYSYLSKPAVQQQLELFAQDTTAIEKLVLKKAGA